MRASLRLSVVSPSFRIAATLVLTALASATVGAIPATAYSCAAVTPGSLDRFEVVFVGSVTDVDTANHLLTVTVDEVWKGGNIPEAVTMPAPEIGWGNWSDWQPHLGKRITYVFAPERTSSGAFELPICRDWQADAAMLREHRPQALPLFEAEAQPVATGQAPPARPDTGSSGLIAGIGAGALLAAGGATLAWRRRRTD